MNVISFARSLAVSLVGKSRVWSLVKHRKILIPSLVTSISVVMFGCGTNNEKSAEILLQRSEISKFNDSILISSYQNEYLDTDIIWLDVAKSIKRDSPCYVLMQDYDTVINVRGKNGINVSFKYTVIPSDTGSGIPVWASSGISYDSIRREFMCYSIDYRLHSKMLGRIRSTAVLHPTQLIRTQTILLSKNMLDSNIQDTSNDVAWDDPELLDKILGKK